MKKLILTLAVLPTLCFSNIYQAEQAFNGLLKQSKDLGNSFFEKHERDAKRLYPDDAMMRAFYIALKSSEFLNGDTSMR